MSKTVNYFILFVFSILIVLYAALLTTPKGEALNFYIDAPVWIFLQCVAAQWLTLKVYRVIEQGNLTLAGYISRVFIISNLLFTVFVTILVIGLESFIGIQEIEIVHVIATLGMSFLLHILVATYSLAFELVARLQAQQVALANKEKALLDSQVKTLQQHIDPHFLFNNLNVLSALILKSPYEAEEYLVMFSDIYRYILENKSKNLVSLAEELVFVDNYMTLIQTRFSGQYQLNVAVDQDLAETHFVIPCSLQLAIENAVKHNSAGTEQPLHIYIDVLHNYIVVTNDLNEKKFKPASTKLGLTHLEAQCKAVFNRRITVMKTDRFFKLSIPIKGKMIE